MRVRRSAVSDRLVFGDESVVLIGDVVVHLSELPTAVLETITEWTDVDDVMAMLEQRFGPPPDSSSFAATEATLRELEALGLVDRDLAGQLDAR